MEISSTCIHLYANNAKRLDIIENLSEEAVDSGQSAIEDVNSNADVLSIYQEDIAVQLRGKIDKDEKIVRKELLKVWLRILEKYSRPGAPIPSTDMVRKELLEQGVDAAVDAVVDHHWFVFSFMIRDQIQTKVEKGLNNLDMPAFIEEVRDSQTRPEILPGIREKVRQWVLFSTF